MTVTEQAIIPIIDRLARGLVVREIELQDTDRNHGRRYAEAVAKLDGFADAAHRVVNAYGPEQVLRAVRHAVGEVPPATSQGRRMWMEDRTERLAMELRFIFRDEQGH